MAKDNLLERLHFIEPLAKWEGGIGSQQLMVQFGISRQQAYQDLKTYLLQHPQNMQRTSLGHEATHHFSPQYISADVNPHLHWFASGKMPGRVAGESDTVVQRVS
jgi:hypothetical protein